MSLDSLNLNIDYDDEDDDDVGPVDTSTREAPDRAIAEAALATALGKPGLRRLTAQRNEAVIIVVRSLDWAEPIAEAAKRLAPGITSLVVTSKPKRAQYAATPDERLVQQMTRGTGLVLVTHDLTLLTEAQRRAADLVATVPAMNRAIMQQAIRRVCGKAARGLRDTDVVDLGFADLVAALRSGSTPSACRRRLCQARARTFVAAPTDCTPTLDRIPLFGNAAEWAAETREQVSQLEAGAITPYALQNAVLGGPPGTGKSMIVRSLAATIGWPLVSTSIASWFNLGDGYLSGVMHAQEAFITDLLGHEHAIGFLDEMDALPNRATLDGREAEWWTPVITGMLLGMDRLKGSGRALIVIGASNYPERLDAALVRPGRFDRIVPVLPPETAEQRAAVLRYYLGDDLAAEDVAVAGRLSAGATPAAIEAWVKSARRTARWASRPLTLADLLAEIVPPDTRPPEVIRAIAIHEAGHATIAHRLGYPVESISIIPRPVSQGRTVVESAPGITTLAEIQDQVMIALAGRAADEKLGAGASAEAVGDLERATRLLAASHVSFGLAGSLAHRIDQLHAGDLLRYDRGLARKVEDDLAVLKRRVDAMVEAERAVILRLAEALVAQRFLTTAEIVELAGRSARGRTQERLGSGRGQSRTVP